MDKMFLSHSPTVETQRKLAPAFLRHIRASSSQRKFAGKMDFDSALKVVGEFGRNQRKQFILISLSALPMFFQMLVLVFTAATPKWICPEDDKSKLQHCKSLESCCTLKGSICNGAQFTTNFTSIATEWNLLCGQTYKNELAQSIYMAGTLVGAPLIGGLADKHGRKPLWVFSYFVTGGLAFLSGLSPSYNVFVALKFLVGIFAGGGGLIIFVLATESIGPSYRGMCQKYYIYTGARAVLIMLSFL